MEWIQIPQRQQVQQQKEVDEEEDEGEGEDEDEDEGEPLTDKLKIKQDLAVVVQEK